MFRIARRHGDRRGRQRHISYRLLRFGL